MSPPPRVEELKKRYEENPRRFFAPLANEYRKSGDLDAAIDLCRMHLEEQPGHLSGHIVYGQALFESGRAADAKVTFEAAINLDPENLIALRHLGDIGRAAGDVAVATHWYQRVLEADPRNEEVVALIADLQSAPASHGVVVDEPAPPPAPGYGVDGPVAVEPPPIGPGEPTPIIPIAAVAAPVAARAPVPPRASIGLMDLDLDLDLGEGMPSAADLLGTTLAAAGAPIAHEPVPVLDEAFTSADALGTTPAVGEPVFPGAGAASVSLGGPETPLVEVFDTSFNVDRSEKPEPTFAAAAEPEPTFASAEVAPEFGDSLDVTITPEFEPAAREVEAAAGATEPAAGVVEPAVREAEPAAPSPGDFDMLFGAAPIADVYVGGDAAPVATGDAGFVADAFVGRELVDAKLDASSASGTTPPPFVTETMAELYLQQGFRDEALAVYRQLLALDPTDSGLADRVRHLEHGTHSSMALDRASEEIEAAVDAEEKRVSAGLPAVPDHAAEPVAEPAAEPVVELASAPAVELAVAPVAVDRAVEPAVVPPPEPAPAAFETVPAFLVEPPVTVAPAPRVAPAGPSAREIFGRIANRRAIPASGARDAMHAPYDEPAPEPRIAAGPAPEPVEAMVAAPAAAMSAAPRAALDDLFASGGVNSADEGAAIAMASAFPAAPAAAVAPAATVSGLPTRAGTDELSLDSVFHGEVDAGRSAPAVERQSTKLRFDQFFPGAEAPSTPPSSSPSSTVPLPPAPGKGEEDVAQFNDWLKGLKGS